MENAVKNLDYQELKLVTEALNERKTFIDIAPHLSTHIPILLPIYRWWEVGYYYIGCKMYDLFSGKTNLEGSYFLSAKKSLESFPLLKKDGLWGSMVYFDGQHNDSRMNLSLAITAMNHGASCLNYCSAVNIDHENGVVKCRDEISKEEFSVKTKLIINATGPWSDEIRDMNKQGKILETSKGIHIVVPGYFSPTKMGLIDPGSSDGRVIFFLPWQGQVVIGTTDTKFKMHSDSLKATNGEVEFLLREINQMLDVKIEKRDIMSTWAGIRPLVKLHDAKDTKSISRSSFIQLDKKMITISGGKWTTYRKMSEDVVDMIEMNLKGKKSPCLTKEIKMVGGEGWTNHLEIDLARKHHGTPFPIIQHLVQMYGDQAEQFITPDMKYLHKSWPYLESEVAYAVKKEYAYRPIDVLSRRLRCAYLDIESTKECVPKVCQIMGKEFGWSSSRVNQEISQCMKDLDEFTYDSK